MSKQKLFLDFDGTLCNSTKAYCETYELLFSNKKGYRKPDWTKVKQYDLRDECPLVKSTHAMFSEYYFWELLDFMPNAFDQLNILKDYYDIIICSIGTLENLSKKAKWIQDKLPFIEDVILIKNTNNTMDKSIVNMTSGILVDDVASNLESSNAEIKICFDNGFNWNADYKYYKTYDWIELCDFLT